MNPIILGIVLWGLAVVIHFGLRTAISLAREFDIKLYEKNIYSKLRVKLTIYDAILRTIWWTLLPFFAVVLGTLMPVQVRNIFNEYIGVPTLIAACLAALFAHFAIFKLLKNDWDDGLKEALFSFFRKKKY